MLALFTTSRSIELPRVPDVGRAGRPRYDLRAGFNASDASGKCVSAELETLCDFRRRRRPRRDAVFQLNRRWELVILGLQQLQDLLQSGIALTPGHVPSAVRPEFPVLQMQARNPIVMRFDKGNRRLIRRRREMSNVEVDPVVGGLRERRIPTVLVYLRVVVIAHPDLVFRGKIAGPFA